MNEKSTNIKNTLTINHQLSLAHHKEKVFQIMYNFSVITNVNFIRNTKYENDIVENQVVIFDQYHKFSKINVSTPIVAGTRSKFNTLMYNYTISNIF